MYNELRGLLERLQPLQDAAEGAAPHMLDHVRSKTLETRKHLRDILATDFEASLTKILWPKPHVALPGTLEVDWHRAILKLLQLQRAELEAQSHRDASIRDDDTPLVLLPLEVMVQPLQARFQYHFYGDKPTNRTDKPEYFLSHVIDILDTHNDFVLDYIQPVLQEFFMTSALTFEPTYLDATSAFITALLPMLRTKLTTLLPLLSDDPKLLSHLIHQLMAFDDTIRDSWHYSPSGTSTTTIWRGLTSFVLTTHSLFPRWLQLEKDFALTRYQSIIDDSNNTQLDFDAVSAPTGDSLLTSAPSHAAILLHDLLTSITDIYRPLPSFSQRLRFLMDIQIAILDRFHERLHASLEAYLALISPLSRTVQGASAADIEASHGVAGLDRLCRVHGSAEYLERAMRTWSDDVFFLTLWTELQERAAAGGNRLPLPTASIAARTSSTLTAPDDLAVPTGALFDETASAYMRLRERAESLLASALITSTRDALRPYTRLAAWSSLSNPAANIPESPPAPDLVLPSAELAPALAVLGEGLHFLSSALAPLSLRRVGRAVAKSVETVLWDRVLLPHSFSGVGAAQLATDVEVLQSTFESTVGIGQGAVGMMGIYEAVKLLSLPIDRPGAPVNTATEGGKPTKERKRDSAEDRTDAQNLTLREVEHRLFSDNESAREVLELLGMEVLTEGEARKVLERRIELGQ